MSGFNPKWLVGKTIKAVEMNPWLSQRIPGEKATAPIIRFTDGSYIHFWTQETETGEYGTGIAYHKAKATGETP